MNPSNDQSNKSSSLTSQVGIDDAATATIASAITAPAPDQIFPDCTLFYNKFGFCLRPTTQLKAIYREGEVADCAQHWADWSDCLYAKLLKDPGEIEVSLEFECRHAMHLAVG
jgi:hypothetical protein